MASPTKWCCGEFQTTRHLGNDSTGSPKISIAGVAYQQLDPIVPLVLRHAVYRWPAPRVSLHSLTTQLVNSPPQSGVQTTSSISSSPGEDKLWLIIATRPVTHWGESVLVANWSCCCGVHVPVIGGWLRVIEKTSWRKNSTVMDFFIFVLDSNKWSWSWAGLKT